MNDTNLPIPGSVLLLSQNNIILSPRPSNDINDPLRWTGTRKKVHVAMLVVYTMTTGIASASLYSVLAPLAESTGLELSTLNEGTGYMFLLLGWGGLITQPLAMTCGKRGMYIVSSLAHLGTVVWMGYITTKPQWLANKLLQGFFASPIEMLVEVSIADVFYAHERGFYIGAYGMVLFTSNFVAPIWAGYVNQLCGYKWVFWVSAIQLAVGIVLLFCFLEETNYNRGTTELGDKHAPTPSRHDSEHQSAEATTPLDETKDELKMSMSATPNSTYPTLEPAHTLSAAPTLTTDTQLTGTPTPFFHKLAMFNKQYTSLHTLGVMVYRPLLLLRFPVIVWSGFLYGSALIWFNVLNATSSLIFSTIYGFRSGAVGLTYLGPTAGALLAAGWSGWAADKFSLSRAARKQGVREPEDRLWLLALNAVVLPAGLVLWGVGAAHRVHWMGLVVGGSLVAFTSASGGAFAINYALDSYKDLSGEVMITVMLIRNTLSFAIGYGITPWVDAMGFQNTFVTAAMVGMAVYASFLVVLKYGKSWRRLGRARYWRYVEEGVMPH